MIILDSPQAAANWCAERLREGRSIGMVPTMGALHAGHLALVDRAVAENDLCVVSIFVNPLQFNEAADFNAYPRDIEDDARMLAEHRCDMVFSGELLQFFPGHAHAEDIPRLDPGPHGQGLEGDHRPGHFAGVRTIVERLFDTVRPQRAYFGQKDFQQTLVIRDLARSMGYPEIVVCDTVREADGLAMSSRNRRLDPADRARATVLYRALLAARDAWRAGERRPGPLADAMRAVMADSDLLLEYAAVRDPMAWQEDDPWRPLARGQALIAARLGAVRLIDNLDLDR